MDTNTVVIAASEEATPVIETLQTLGMEYGMKILGALVILVVGMWLAKQVRKVIITVMSLM